MAMPNVRSMFVPDQEYIMFDTDLDSADLRIVQRESNCKILKEWLDAGKKPYVEVAKEYYNDQSITKKHPAYSKFKSLCHATHYLGQPDTIATQANIGLDVKEVRRIQAWYFELCPEIKEWHEKLIDQIKRTATIYNAFGFRRQFVDRIDNATFREAAAWIPQSTVVLIINKAWVNIHRNLPEVQVLLQVHDSLVGQYPNTMPEMREQILEQGKIVVPYKDPLVIPMGIKVSEVSWGECE